MTNSIKSFFTSKITSPRRNNRKIKSINSRETGTPGMIQEDTRYFYEAF